MEVRLDLIGGTIDFLDVLNGVPVRGELPEDIVEPSCLVGDLLGDFRGISRALLCF